MALLVVLLVLERVLRATGFSVPVAILEERVEHQYHVGNVLFLGPLGVVTEDCREDLLSLGGSEP